MVSLLYSNYTILQAGIDHETMPANMGNPSNAAKTHTQLLHGLRGQARLRRRRGAEQEEADTCARGSTVT